MSMEDTNPSTQAPADPSSSSSSLERRPSVDEESAVMTIEFLRARLLSERSVSKAARQRAQLLSKKISELEERLEAEIQLRKKLEADRIEILAKYRSELSEEYGEFFASSFGEDLSRNESHTPDEEEEGLSSSRAEHLGRSNSSQRLNHEEANGEDEEADQSGREKGVLSWGKQRGSKKDFGHGTDWLGRSLSQRSLASTSGDSPQKKWAGKSVRQIRKRENSNFEGEPEQSQVSEDFNGESGQPDDMKERLQCEDERDTEVERVLERQAEFIEKFEAEENAQKAWEAKFKEAKALANYESGIKQSNSSSDVETLTKNVLPMSLAKDGATKLIETESTMNEGSTKYSGKVHPEDCPGSKETQGGLVQSETIQMMPSQYTPESGSEKNKGSTAGVKEEACSSTNQSKIGSTALQEHILEEAKSRVVESTTKVDGPNGRSTETDPLDEDSRLHEVESSCSVSNENVSQDQAHSNTDSEQRVDHSKVPAVELGKSGKYLKHLSSSFRFTVFADAEPPTSTSPQMPGFAMYKQETNMVEEGEAGKEEVHLSGSTATSEQRSGFGLSEPCHDKLHGHVVTTASLDRHISVDRHPLVSEGSSLSTNDTDSQGKSKDISHEATWKQEHLAAENGVLDHITNRDVGNDTNSDSNREEILQRRTSSLGSGQDPGRQYSDLSSFPESRGLGASLQPGLGRHYPDLTSHLQSSLQQLHMALKDSDGAHLRNFASLPANRSGLPGPILNANAYEDTALISQRRSVDGGFDRVADVLRTLQIAKYQLESSVEPATRLAIDAPYRNGYDGRDAYYVESPHLPSVYTAPPSYTSPIPHPSRGVPPFSQNMQGWSAMQAGYGAGSSRQLANMPYMQYASRMAEPQNFWPPPPPQGVPNSNLYHYDARQYR